MSLQCRVNEVPVQLTANRHIQIIASCLVGKGFIAFSTMFYKERAADRKEREKDRKDLVFKSFFFFFSQKEKRKKK